MNIEQIARIANETNREYCLAQGDFSIPKWLDAPDWHKNSLIAGVNALRENPDRTPEESHQGWMEMKQKEGWSFGMVKNVDCKKHPCMVPYNELPKYQRVKDSLFTGIVKTLLPLLDE